MVAVHLFLYLAYALPILGNVASMVGNGISMFGNVVWNGLETHELANQKLKEVGKLAKISFGISAGVLLLGHFAHRYRQRREKKLLNRLSKSLIMNDRIETTFIPRVYPKALNPGDNSFRKPNAVVTSLNIANVVEPSRNH